MPDSVIAKLFSAELLDPAKLWLFVPLLVLVLLLGGILFTKKEYRALRSLTFRLMVAALLALAISDPIKKESQSSEQLIALADVSASVPKAGLVSLVERLSKFAKSEGSLSISLFPFAKKPSHTPLIINENTPTDKIVESILDQADRLDRGETDLGAALQYVAGHSPGAAIILLSDGYETSGNAKETARTLSATGGRIYPLITNEELFRLGALELSMVQAPLTSKAGDLLEVRLTARNSASNTQHGKMEVKIDDKPLLNQQISVPASEERLVIAKSPALEGGLHKIQATLTSATGEKQELQRWVSVRKKSRLFLISGNKDDERILKLLLTLKGYTVDTILADNPADIPKSFEECSGVILNNVSNDQLPSGFLPALKNYTERGGGVLLVGGDRSYGLGNFINTPLEEISPLKFIPPRTAKRRLIKAIALVIDKSKSMATDGKINGARDASLLAIQSLQDEDYVTVIGFDRVAFVVIPVEKVADVRSRAAFRLSNLVATGGTDLLPALIEARRRLVRVPADIKHTIVLSDGDVPFTDQYLEEIARYRQEKITLSTVALGADANAPFLDMLRTQGNGRFHQSLSSATLPRIFIDDIKVAAGEKTFREAIFPVGVGPAGLLSATAANFPPLLGFVETLPKKGANIELITKGQENVSPLLASWNFGAGKVIAFTSDANGRWSKQWRSWEAFPRFWSQLIEEVEHSPDENASQVDFDLRTSVNRKTLYLDLYVYDDRLRSGAAPKITSEVILPGGEKRTVSFLPEKRGRFRAAIDNARPGDYKIQIVYGTQKLPLIGTTLDGALFGERPGRGINRESLAELASLSGGLVNPEPAQVSRAVKTSEKVEHLFVPLAILAFFLFLTEVFLRELGVRALFARLRRVLNARSIENAGAALTKKKKKKEKDVTRTSLRRSAQR